VIGYEHPHADGDDAVHFDVELADGEAALRSVAAEILGSRRVATALLSHFAIRKLAAVVPGLREVALLVRALQHTDAGQHVVIDMPATGHGLAWLDTVRLLHSLQPTGRARQLIDRLEAKLADRSFTKLVVVTLGERLVMAETLELCRALPRRADLVVINGVHRPPALPDDILAGIGRTTPGLAAAVASLRTWAAPTETIPDLGTATCELPRLTHRPTPAEVVRAFAPQVFS
jgi:hypothetical protein